tara:strand:+ start:197 stop:526 length:330 start_codon:yes stop_codon:yes gene_type:complete
MPTLAPAPTGGNAVRESPAIVRIKSQRERITTLNNELFLAERASDYDLAARYREQLLKAADALRELESTVLGTDAEIRDQMKSLTPDKRFDFLAQLTAFRNGWNDKVDF